jgi:FkbM family methyltransferase
MFIKELLAKSFLFNLFTLARFSHAKKYLLKNLLHKIDPYQAYVLSKNRERSLSIWALQQIKHRKKHLSDDLYFWQMHEELWLANLDHIHGLYEYLQGSFHEFYRCDCRGKTVLDIGGYIGDSARFFLKQGTRKVIIYEPVEKNVMCMRYNLKDYQNAVEIIPKGIAGQNGELTIFSNYPAGHIGFGNRSGKYKLTAQAESFPSILSHVQADIAKVDCEGSERYLLDVECKALRRIPYWMIELHDGQIAEQIERKFLKCGFETIPMPVPAGHQSIGHYRLNLVG